MSWKRITMITTINQNHLDPPFHSSPTRIPYLTHPQTSPPPAPSLEPNPPPTELVNTPNTIQAINAHIYTQDKPSPITFPTTIHTHVPNPNISKHPKSKLSNLSTIPIPNSFHMEDLPTIPHTIQKLIPNLQTNQTTQSPSTEKTCLPLYTANIPPGPDHQRPIT